MRHRHNKRKATPIPGLAHHIAWFTSGRARKAELNAIRMAFADTVYAASSPLIRKEKTQCR